MSYQQIASILRQVAAFAAVVVGAVSTSSTALGMSKTEGAVLTAIGGILLTVEHYVSDPSTGASQTTVVNRPAPVPEIPHTAS